MDKIDSRPRTLKELAQRYNVSKNTFKSWLLYDSLKHIKPIGRFFSILQIKEIVNHLGEPD